MIRRGSIAAAAVLAGCVACDAAPTDALTRCETTQVLPSSVATDILFVIDDSGSMSEEQAKKARKNLAETPA